MFAKNKKSMRNNINRYEAISHIYQLLGDHYSDARKRGILDMELEKGAHVLDLCSGTGRNLPYLDDIIGEHGVIYSLDSSNRMQNFAKNKSLSCSVEYLIEDASNMSLNKIPTLDGVVCTFGLSIVKDWENVFIDTYNKLKPDGSYLILDFLFEKPTMASRIIGGFSGASMCRDTSKLLRQMGCDVRSVKVPKFGGHLLVTTAKKASDI